MRIPDEVIAEIRERTDIVTIVGEHVQLKQAGNTHRGLCPFHQEKTPSFHVIPAKRFFHCFGCQKSGDVFRFVMELQGKSFAETVRELGQRVGVVVAAGGDSPEEKARRDHRARFLDVNAIAAAFYRETLQGPAGARGREYLASRGIGDEVAETFRLGMAPDAWDALWKHLEARRVHAEVATSLGLTAPRQKGSGHYDRFRNRLMCPVILPAGEVVAFSGRTLGNDPESPKYINSTGSPVYTKGNVLFGLHAARPAFRLKGRAIVVEGNFDVIALHQAGFTETIAPLGTALTDKQVETLRMLAPRVVLCLDGDKAGRRAALKDIEPLVAAGIETRVVELPDGEDPDSYVRKHGAAGLEALMARAQPAIEYYLRACWTQSDGSVDQRAVALKTGVPLLARLEDETRRELVIGEFAAALGIDPRVIRRALAQHKQGGAANQGSPTERPEPPRPAQKAPLPPATELKILAILADHPELLPMAEEQGVRSLLTDERLRDMYSAAQEGRPLHDVAPSEISGIVAKEVLSGSYMALADPRRTLLEAVRMIRSEQLQADIGDLDRQLKEAQRRGDRAQARELAMRMLETRNRADSLRRRPEEEPR